MIGIKKGTCWNENGVLYISDESLYSTPETNTALYANSILNKILEEKQKKKTKPKNKQKRFV